jgi:phytoene desaturase
MYAGLSPFEALALYCVITYMDTVEGVFFPEGGMHAVPRGLAAAAEKAGASFQYGVTVERVVRDTDGKVLGVACADGDLVRADAVVLNPDLPVAYDELLPGVAAPRVARRSRRQRFTTTSTSARRGLRLSTRS